MIVSLEPELLRQLAPPQPAGDTATAARQAVDAQLAAAIRRTALARRLFYAAVLTVACYGTATGVTSRFGLPWPVAVGGTLTLELGGVVFLSNAETRRRLGETATTSRLLGAAVAGAATAFNAASHTSVLLGGFFALMSALGFAAWWLDGENKRRDRLRAHGQLAAATPTYDLFSHRLRHPTLTRRARQLAKAHPQLGLYGSLEAAVATLRRDKRNAALTAALRKRIRAAVDADMAQIAVLTFDLDQVADRLRRDADCDGLTALLASDLTAERVLRGRHNHRTPPPRTWPGDHPDSVHGTRNRQGGQQPPTDLGQPTRPPHPDNRPVDTGPARPAEPPATSESALQNSTGTGTPPDNGPAKPMHGRQEATADGATAGDTVGDNGAEGTVSAQILGRPSLLDVNGQPVRGLRNKSIELLVYLAVHRQGASQADIVEAIWPDITPERALQRLSTCLANLRSVIRHARQPASNTDSTAEPVRYAAGNYRLNPDAITVDWWLIMDSHTQPATTADDRAQLATTAATIAAGSTYPWIDIARQRAYDAAKTTEVETDPWPADRPTGWLRS
ncbi:AfsR/SARP family transcriptional regulator [Phytohabitans houttuyneae]|uniref:Bacterial transcriptional activator domain-containing protein n=1 Tax=Phytohabitans houttuyneae TaxID=1076126 RepID=A0A6V8KHZ6_9ACTN|nr:hypothetical protein [Phytohabitans houttuyneae]GFJ82091.1 hypothetical protein Phou_062710 [Phytohabitans houttuyneae]